MTKQNEMKQDCKCDDEEVLTEDLPTGDNAVTDRKKNNKALAGMKENVDDYLPISNRAIVD
jgi:hypothetical protein